MRIREYLETVVSFNQPVFSGSIGICSPNIGHWSSNVNKINELLYGFNVSFEQEDLESTLSNMPKFETNGPVEAIWRVYIPKKELYMKFTALGFNPPGGVAAQKTLLQFNTIFINVIEDFTNPNYSLVILAA